MADATQATPYTQSSQGQGTKKPIVSTSIPHPSAQPQRAYSSYTLDEVSKHNKPGDLWIIANGEVFDLTEFSHRHPGGVKIMQNVAGQDASKQVNRFHRPQTIARRKAELKIGNVRVEMRKKEKEKEKGRFGRWFGKGEALPQ